jgi:hypothetical protein
MNKRWGAFFYFIILGMIFLLSSHAANERSGFGVSSFSGDEEFEAFFDCIEKFTHRFDEIEEMDGPYTWDRFLAFAKDGSFAEFLEWLTREYRSGGAVRAGSTESSQNYRGRTPRESRLLACLDSLLAGDVLPAAPSRATFKKEKEDHPTDAMRNVLPASIGPLKTEPGQGGVVEWSMGSSRYSVDSKKESAPGTIEWSRPRPSQAKSSPAPLA